MSDTTAAATCAACGGSGMTNTLRGDDYICRTCGGSGKRSGYVWHSAPAPLPAGSTVTIKPAPDPRVTALVTAAREVVRSCTWRNVCLMCTQVDDTHSNDCAVGALTAALEAFPND